jgi:hypothetical protein
MPIIIHISFLFLFFILLLMSSGVVAICIQLFLPAKNALDKVLVSTLMVPAIGLALVGAAGVIDLLVLEPWF